MRRRNPPLPRQASRCHRPARRVRYPLPRARPPRKGFLDVGAAFVADAQSPVLVQPRKAALDDPVLASERGRVRALWPGDFRLDVTATQFAAAAVTHRLVRPGSASPSGHHISPALKRLRHRPRPLEVRQLAEEHRQVRRPANHAAGARSSAKAARNAVCSPHAPATICAAVGRPSPSTPLGTEMAGWPVRLSGAVL